MDFHSYICKRSTKSDVQVRSQGRKCKFGEGRKLRARNVIVLNFNVLTEASAEEEVKSGVFILTFDFKVFTYLTPKPYTLIQRIYHGFQ